MHVSRIEAADNPRWPISIDALAVVLALMYVVVVGSGFFTRSNWMLGDLAYHRGVAYSMQGGNIQGEGPLPGLITYYGGLFSLGLGAAAEVVDKSFDQVLSVLSWFMGVPWVLALWALGRRIWPADRPTVAAFVVLGAGAMPFTTDSDSLWVESTLAGVQAFWPLYPRDVALILMPIVGLALLAGDRRVRIVGAGLAIGLIVMFHLQLAVLAGWLVAVTVVVRWWRDRDRATLLEVPLVAGVALLLSSWWWLPRVGPTLAGSGLLLADYPGRLPLRLDLETYVVDMGMVGALSLLGFAVLAGRRTSLGESMVLAWAAALLPLILIDRLVDGVDLFSERRIWLLFSIPATAAAAIAARRVAALLPRWIVVAGLLMALVTSVPGLRATLGVLRNAWADGAAGGMAYNPTVWRPLWSELNARVRAGGSVVLGTYDTYAAWTWSFSGAQPTSLWLPGPFKLGFDPKTTTGEGYLERTRSLERAFSGAPSMCSEFARQKVDVLLLDRRSGLVATYDRTPAMDYRVEPPDRTILSIDREVAPAVEYRDQNAFDLLLLHPGGTYRVPWISAGVRRVVITAQARQGTAAFEIRAGGQVISPTITGSGPTAFAIATPQGLPDGVTITATRDTRLYRISGYEAVLGLTGGDGPFITDRSQACP